MQPIEIFPSHVYGKSFLGLDNNYLKQLETSIELMRRGDVNGKAYSNTSFGWQSDVLPQSGPFEKLTQELTKSSLNFCKKLRLLKVKKIEMTSLWANINYQGDVNWPHKHGGDLSGAYYIKTPTNCGNLLLTSYQYNLNSVIERHFKRKYELEIEAVQDRLVLFDSQCTHMVTMNKSMEPRISVSFNLVAREI